MQRQICANPDRQYFITFVFEGQETMYRLIKHDIKPGDYFAKAAKATRLLLAKAHRVNPASIAWGVYELINGEYFLVSWSPTFETCAI